MLDDIKILIEDETDREMLNQFLESSSEEGIQDLINDYYASESIMDTPIGETCFVEVVLPTRIPKQVKFRVMQEHADESNDQLVGRFYESVAKRLGRLLMPFVQPPDLTDDDLLNLNKIIKENPFKYMGKIMRPDRSIKLTDRNATAHSVKRTKEESRLPFQEAQATISKALFMVDQGKNTEKDDHVYAYIAVKISADDLKNKIFSACVPIAISVSGNKPVKELTSWYIPGPYADRDEQFLEFMVAVLKYFNNKDKEG